MERLDRALGEFRQMEELAVSDSPIHRLHPLAKFLTTVLYILIVVSYPKYALRAMPVMALFPILLYQIARIPLSLCFYRLRYILPLVCAVGLFNPFFDRTPAFQIGALTVTGGMISFLTLLCKGVLCLTASFLLVATTRFDALCAALRKLHVPSLLTNLLLLTYRYITVLMEEASAMTTAYHLRAPGQKGIHISAWGSFLGQLLLRSMDRAEDLFRAMQLRGWHGHFHYVDLPSFTARDAAYVCGGAALLALVRLVDIAGLVGSLLVR